MKYWAKSTAVVALLACTSPAWANDDVIKLSSDPNNWVIQSGDYAGHRYSKLDQITTENVGQLKVAWTFSTGVLRGHEGGPLVVGDVMYLHSAFPNIVFALNLADEQKIIWKYVPKQDPSVIPVMCCDTVNRGVQYAEGKIFLHQADTSLVALDAKTGKELWKVVDGDPKKGQTGTGAPLVVKDKVIIGVSGAEFGVRCWLSAPDLTNSLKTLSYGDFAKIVAAGKRDVNTAQTLVMPSWGTNKNVMCYLDDIYVYLRARSDGALGPVRPKHQAKPAAAELRK